MADIYDTDSWILLLPRMDTTGYCRRLRPPNDPRLPDHDPEPHGYPGYDERDSGVAVDGGEAFQALGEH
jgi:hypothetical protein